LGSVRCPGDRSGSRDERSVITEHAEELRRLHRKTSEALFALQRYMREHDDLWWREVYRHANELGWLIDARIACWKRERGET
jgi:hypothetical protein